MEESNLIGRDKEVALLSRLLQSEKPRFLAIYGRRRVGKTFLIRNYFKTNIQFSFSGSFEETTKVQLQNFFSEYLTRTNGKKETTPPKDWSTAFHYLLKHIESLSHKKKKIVIFIDELPWLDRPKSGFVKALEYFWNQHISTMNNVLLIVCGSSASWMQKKILKSKGGLYNRITNRIRLEPFSLAETEKFIKHKKLKLTRYQIIQLYMVMGGVPFYLDELTQGKSVEQLIDSVCFSPTGLLHDEYEKLYYSLFKNAGNHMKIIKALGNSPNGLSRDVVLKKSKLPEGGTFSRALDELLESGFIVKFNPFKKKKKDAIYKLIDFYSLFYLKFIQRNKSKSSLTWQKIANGNSFKAWSGYAYENICFIHSAQIIKKLGLSGTFTDMSSWKHRGDHETDGAQIDMLIDRKDGVINLCEVKFTENNFIISKQFVSSLRKKRSVFSHVTKTKKSVTTTLITTHPVIQNHYYLEEIHSEINMKDLFTDDI